MLEEMRNKRSALHPVQTKQESYDPSVVLQQLRENKEKADANNVEKWLDALKEVVIPCKLKKEL